MSEKAVYYVGTDPHGYGGVEVSQEQAEAYAEAIAAEIRLMHPDQPVAVGIPDGYFPSGEQLVIHGWVQAQWRTVRKRVNAARGWEEQFGGALWTKPT